MLEDLEQIALRTADRDVLALTELLRMEVGHRLAFEEACRDYLRDAGANPFAASRRFLDFLEGELRQEPGLSLPQPSLATMSRTVRPGETFEDWRGR